MLWPWQFSRYEEELAWSQDPRLQVQAAQKLGESGRRKAVPSLVKSLQERESGRLSVAIAAANALGQIRDPGAVVALGDRLNNPGQMDWSSVAIAIVSALAAIRH